MSKIELRRLSNLAFFDPEPFLVRLREIQFALASADSLPENVRNLRTRSLQRWRELRAGAIFAHGVSNKIRRKVWIADEALEDYDLVTGWIDEDGGANFTKVQIKEVVRPQLNSQASAQAIVDALLERYPTSSDLSVAVHLTACEHFDPAKLVIPKLGIGSLWFFGATSADNLRWRLWGNLLQSRDCFDFSYPRCAYDYPTCHVLVRWPPLQCK